MHMCGMLLGLFAAICPVGALAEYYNQHYIPYGGDGVGMNKTYGDESSMISADESSILGDDKGYYGPVFKVGLDELQKGRGLQDTDVQGFSSPAGAVRSLRVGRFRTDPESVGDLLYREMADMSPDLHSKLATTLAHNNVDHKKYRDLFLIKKRVIDDGTRRIINFNIKEKIVPRAEEDEFSISRDLGTRALLGGIMFLLAGLVFTTTLKMYQSIIRKNYFAVEDKNDLFAETQKTPQ